MRSPAWALFLQCAIGLVAMTATFMVLSRYVPFASDLPLLPLLGIALLWGTLRSTSMDDFNVLGHEPLGSVAMGTTLGLLLAAYLKLVGKKPADRADCTPLRHERLHALRAHRSAAFLHDRSGGSLARSGPRLFTGCRESF